MHVRTEHKSGRSGRDWGKEQARISRPLLFVPKLPFETGNSKLPFPNMHKCQRLKSQQSKNNTVQCQ